MDRQNPYTVQRVSWAAERAAIEAVRRAVFIEEQGIPEALEWDGRDPECVHVLARDGERPLATARLCPGGQIGRMAVLREARGHGLGARMLALVLEVAREQGLKRVWMSAQMEVLGFYRRAGFVAEGPVYEEAGIAHQRMARLL